MLIPGGRLGLGGPPVTAMPGGSLGLLEVTGLGPPDTLTPSPDSLELTPASGSWERLTWRPSPASLLMSGPCCSLLLWI